MDDLLSTIHQRFEAIRKENGDAAVAGLASATNTNEALFLMKKYFRGNVDFRLGNEVETYQKRQDDMLRREDKHPNTQGALDLGISTGVNGLAGMIQLAESKQIRGMWVAFHPQLVGDDAPEVIAGLQRLIGALEFSVVSTTHEFAWTAGATLVLPMAGWAEETGTYTNFSGRVQITSQAVDPPGHAQPLHVMMSKLMTMAGTPSSADPANIFESITREVASYAGMDYESIGALGVNATPEEVVK